MSSLVKLSAGLYLSSFMEGISIIKLMLFSRVWIDDATVSQIVNSNVSKEHELANKLLNFNKCLIENNEDHIDNTLINI